MSERYTTDVPAIEDPDYVYVNPERKDDIFERALSDPESGLSDSLRDMFEDAVLQRQEKKPIAYDHFFENFFVASDAQSFIDSCAVYDHDGRLNIDLTSSQLGIPYNYNMEHRFAHGEIVGLSGHNAAERPIEIHLDPKRRLRQVTFGHEVGHYFWRDVMAMGTPGYNRTEEDFCNYFGRQMAFPDRHLQDYKSIDETTLVGIMNRFQSELGDTILALMEHDLLPNRVAVDTYNGVRPNLDYSEMVTRGVFCLHCDQVGGDYGCPNVDQPTPLFDFTDRAWGGIMHSCLGENLYKPEIMSTLTKHYVMNEAQLVLFRPETY